jgi:hypothetical protein
VDVDPHSDPVDASRPHRPSIAGRHRAANIYGTIITAAVMASAGDHLPTLTLAAAVVVTLVVYWLAEEYAELLGEQARAGHLPSWPEIRSSLALSWPMVTASLVPVASLVVARIAGLSASDAADVGLVVAIVLLAAHAFSAGKAAQLSGVQLGAVTVFACVLGLVMISLKVFITEL